MSSCLRVALLLVAAQVAASMCSSAIPACAMGSLRLRGGEGEGGSPGMPPGFDPAAMNSMFSNPAFQNMAQGLMNNPEFKEKMENMMKNETLMQASPSALSFSRDVPFLLLA